AAARSRSPRTTPTCRAARRARAARACASGPRRLRDRVLAANSSGHYSVVDSPRMKSPSRLTTSTMAARIPYANAAPFYALWADAPFAVRNLVPRDLGREAEAGRVDLGLMAAADYLRLKPRFELLGRLGVATRGPVQSVLLYSRRPANALANALISVTPETSTSIRLLRLLLDVRRGLEGVRYGR